MASRTKTDERFKPERYGMIFCPGCSGSGRSLEDTKGVDVCSICGGFGLIRKDERKASRIKGVPLNFPEELVRDQT
jgi:rRNA maturation endonuclease Nob1